jgi:hypothetical protein
MNRTLQAALIQEQIAAIHQDADCKVITQPNPLQLHLDIKGFGERRYHLVLDLEDYDVGPAWLYVLGPDGKPAWTTEVMPPHPMGNTGLHPTEKRMFLCVAGTRDFHTHPLHEHEPWDQLRNNMPLSRLVANIRSMLRNAPQVVLPPFQLQVPADWTRVVIQIHTAAGNTAEFTMVRQ